MRPTHYIFAMRGNFILSMEPRDDVNQSIIDAYNMLTSPEFPGDEVWVVDLVGDVVFKHSRQMVALVLQEAS